MNNSEVVGYFLACIDRLFIIPEYNGFISTESKFYINLTKLCKSHIELFRKYE